MKFSLANITNFLQGKHFTVALWFAGSGFYLAFQGKLTFPYVALAGAVQAIVAGRSVAEDFAKLKNP